MTTKNLLTYLTCTLAIYSSFGQQDTVTTGGIASNTNGEISYSIGQTFYLSESNGSNTIQQGLQQAFEISETLNNDLFHLDLDIKAYPNPTTNTFFISTDISKNPDLRYQFVDINGRIISKGYLTQNKSPLNVSKLNQATYVLTIYKKNDLVKSYKIIKK
ncbi:Por secretion system C-terminal sorting domain-containing protein [Bizionia echini]|uniref:Por secretion system C-terminal sorting domain-containing protein n=1 Tax=Bizionia echini TaxID=649333 RepID=A0A1I5AGV1_9FLAO|nr:T9SS type A sorting domain-containing protein [Bizionia echini]SFN61665.1 Por secretion system C-terminal sorting domain-containing protein [Bizionia echini]